MEPRRLKRSDRQPRGGWWYDCAGVVLRGTSKNNLLDVVIRHLIINGEEVPTREKLWDVIEQQICERQPDGLCTGDTRKRYWTINELRSGVTALGKLVIGRENALVSQEEAEQRASECASCPNNTNLLGCWSCVTIFVPMISGLLRRKTEFDSRLRICDVCGCVNGAQVHAKDDVLRSVSDLSKIPLYPDCWKKRALDGSVKA